MCGIVGGFGRVGQWPIEEMMGAIAHRGPDHQASFVEANVFLGHTRLSIQDLSESGNQPMFSEDGRLVIIFNGEIYNHFELRGELNARHYRSTSDTETLVAAYQQWGIDCLAKLNGIFAFALYDRQEQTLLLARDRFGIKPLYFSSLKHSVSFSSELKALLPVIADRSIDVTALDNYLTFLWSPGVRTPFLSVNKLDPGSSIKFHFVGEELKMEKKEFYQVPFIGKYSDSSEKELIDLCEKKILQAVDRQLLSDVPVGFFLSGGVDSSLLVAMAKRLHPEKTLNCFTIDAGSEISEEGFADDLGYAKKVANHLKVDLHIVKADIDILRDFDKMIWHLDEPQADAAPLNVSNICQQARSMGFKVLIGGTAGDDVFSGYRRHQALEIEKYLKLLPRWVIEGLLKLPLNRKNPFFRRVAKVLKESTQTIEQRLANYYRWLPKETVEQLFSKQYQSIVKQHDPTEYLIDRLADIQNETSWLNRMLYWEMTSFLVDHNLNYTDKMAMAHGVEVRVPFLDNELVEFACTIPPSLKMKGKETKYILKKVAERYLPNEVIYRPKTGFGAPVRKWITTDMKPLIAERLSPKRISDVGVFDSQKVQQLIADNEAGKIDASYSIWSLLAIDSWIHQFSTQKTTEILETTNSKS